jgi:hypothetical protein
LRLRRAGLEPREVRADKRIDLAADGGSRIRVAARALLDHPFERGNGKGHTRRLDRLQVDRREQPRLAGVASLRRRVGEYVDQVADPLTIGMSQRSSRIAGLAEIANCGEGTGNVDGLSRADRNDRRTARVRPPDPAGQHGALPVLRQRLLDRGIEFRGVRHRGEPLGGAQGQ